ncbi:hypothetical protein E2C01_095550 [Portunus trituberculatus]|uniref:Uncharacterized protein n=1 Tax=Portunus trituberculatus TaxID=210409 RepID=A0A5B7JZ54_PORTR|nr:hypothetical protein [Portunus trituberculatus]
MCIKTVASRLPTSGSHHNRPPLPTSSHIVPQSPTLVCPPLPRHTPSTVIEDCVPYPSSLYG